MYSLGVFLLTGCSKYTLFPELEAYARQVKKQNSLTEVQIKNITSSTQDGFKKSSWIKSPKYSLWNPDLNLNEHIFRIGSYVIMRRDTKYDFYQIYITAGHKNWMFYENAFDTYGNRLEFVTIDRQVTDYGIKEVFALTVDRKYLELIKKDENFTFKVYGKRGSNIIVYPGKYIRGFLDKVDIIEGK